MQFVRNRIPRSIVYLAVLGVAAVALMGLRGNTQNRYSSAPVQPSAQALSMQNAFESVATHLAPTVVYIESQHTLRPGMQGQQGFGQNGGGFDFTFPFQGFPGAPGQGGGRTFQMTPQFPQHATDSGSGVIVRSDGWILTNDHVVAGASKVTVRLEDGRQFTGQVRRDFRGDIAMIKIPADNLPVADLGNSDDVRVGQWAIAFGSPFQLNNTMTVGVISGLHREETIAEGQQARLYPQLFQTDASINPGNSGGPLCDIYGRVIGINVAIESPSGVSAGIGFAIPANEARYAMEQLISKGSVTRGYLGLAPTTLTYAEQQHYGIRQGALVSSVEDNTPASHAGFQVEDIITRYDNKPVADDASLRDMVARTRPGDTVPVVVLRSGAQRTLNVTVGTAPDTEVAGNQPAPAPDNVQSRLGLSVGSATDPQLRQQFSLPKDVHSGAVVVSVAPGSPADDAGVQPGDVIERLDGKPVADPSQLAEAARGLRSGALVTAVLRRGSATVLAQLTLD